MSVVDPRTAPRGRPQGSDSPPGQTRTFRGWTGLNLTDSRITLKDEELYARQNVMPVGLGEQCVPIYNGDPGDVIHDATIKDSQGFEMTFPGDTSPRDVAILVFADGAAYQRDYSTDPPTDTEIAPAGTFDTSLITGITIFRDGPVLFLDQTAGYAKWDGVTFTVIDGTKTGQYLAVFEDRAWLATGTRVLDVSSPTTYDDFDPANGATIVRITDEAFEGAIFQLFSTVQQLWVFGDSAIEAISNVQTNGGLTTMSIENAVRSLGSVHPNSIIAYYRLIVFYTGYSIHAILGVTPQKLSGKLDRVFARLSGPIPQGPTAGLVTLNGQTILCFLVNFDDPVFSTQRNILLCFVEGQWFIAQPPIFASKQVLSLVTLKPQGIFELYGVNEAGEMFRVFARSSDARQGDGVVLTKLYDLGEPVSQHESLEVGIDFSAPIDVADAEVDVTIDSEGNSKTDTKTVTFLAQTDSPLGLRYGFIRTKAQLGGQRLGVSLRMDCTDRLCVEAIHLRYDTYGDWTRRQT